ncbi:hypothetical protein [Micromonospora sp. NPDC004704]
MGVRRQDPEARRDAVIGILISVVVFGAGVGLFAFADYIDIVIVDRLLFIVAVLVMFGGAFFATLAFSTAVLGPGLTEKLFFVQDKALTPEVVTDLRAKESAPSTVPVSSGQGILRVIPVRPEWWLDDTYAEYATPVVAVEDAEHRLPGWDPYDIAVRAGGPAVVAWMPRASGIPGRRTRSLVSVPEGGVGAVVFRPSSVPELGGTLEPLQGELRGKLSTLRVMLGAVLLAVVTCAVWALFGG